MRPAGLKGEQNQAIGISRGGRSTKIHAIVDSKGRPLNFTVTGGQVHDSEVVSDVLDTPKPPLAVTADKAYDSEKVRQQIKDEGALPIIPSRRNATRKAYCPKRFYRRRHKIENYFCRIKDWRRIATRYDKLARNFLAATPALASGRLPPILALEIPLPWRPAATRCGSARADPADGQSAVGSARIHGELLKLGFEVSSVAKYMVE